MNKPLSCHKEVPPEATPREMHLAINTEHPGCDLLGCVARRTYWKALINLGHLHPADDPKECSACCPEMCTSSK